MKSGGIKRYVCNSEKMKSMQFFLWHIFHKFSEASSHYKTVISLPSCQLQNLKLFPPMCSQNHCPSLTGEQHLLCMIKRSPWRGQMLLGGRSLLQWPQDWKETQHQLWLRASTRDRKWRGPFYHHSQEQSHIGTTEQPWVMTDYYTGVQKFYLCPEVGLVTHSCK